MCSFGAKFLSNKLGFVYNNEMDDFSAPNVTNEFGLPPSPANFIKPGKRPQSSAVPVMMLDKKGNVLMTIGAAGGTIITTSVAQVSFSLQSLVYLLSVLAPLPPRSSKVKFSYTKILRKHCVC